MKSNASAACTLDFSGGPNSQASDRVIDVTSSMTTSMNDRGACGWTRAFLNKRVAEGYQKVHRMWDNADRKKPTNPSHNMDNTMWNSYVETTGYVRFHACATAEHPSVTVPVDKRKPCDYMDVRPCSEQQTSFEATGESFSPGGMFDNRNLICYTGILAPGKHALSAFRLSAVFYKCEDPPAAAVSVSVNTCGRKKSLNSCTDATTQAECEQSYHTQDGVTGSCGWVDTNCLTTKFCE